MTYAIIKNAELPARAGRPVGGGKYPFAQMDVGDGFDVFPTSPPEEAPSVVANRIRSAAGHWSRRAGSSAKFTVGQLDGGAVRCVRIA